MTEHKHTRTSDEDMALAYRQLHRMTQFFEAWGDMNESHERLISTLIDINPLAAVHYAKKVIEAREYLHLRVSEDLAPLYRDIKRLVQMHEEETSGAQEHPDSTEGGDHHE